MSIVPEKVRIDKWMWAMRLYKTRSLASDACEKGRIKINEIEVKASRAIKPGEVIQIHRGPWHQKVKVLKLWENRMAASLVKDFYEDVTDASELEKLKLHQAAMASWKVDGNRGRPTKKDRRSMDEFMGDW